MPILELPPNPAPLGEKSSEGANQPARPVKVRTGRFGELEEHELIHLIDSLDDERSRSRFRESVYISVIVYLAVAWFILYGPRVLFHQPQYDLVKALKDRDQRLTNLEMPSSIAPKPPVRALPDHKVLQKLQQQRATEAPAAPAPPPPQPAQQPQPQSQAPPPPPEQAHNTPPPPLPSAPPPQPTANKPTPLPDAPSSAPAHPLIAQNNQSAHSAMDSLIRGGRPGQIGSQGGGQYAPSGPLQAGAEILTDTQGVDFSAWLRRLHNDIQRNWDPLIPEEVNPPLSKRGIVGIRFTVKADGEIGAMVLETRSGDVALDHAAWSAITSEGNFPPLPTAFHGPSIELRCGFFYNTPIQQ